MAASYDFVTILPVLIVVISLINQAFAALTRSGQTVKGQLESNIKDSE